MIIENMAWIVGSFVTLALVTGVLAKFGQGGQSW
jgi:hypothetical protein